MTRPGEPAAEAARRAGVVWVELPGHPPRAVWHVWHDGAVHLVTGGQEQPLPGAETAVRARVLVRGRGALGARAGEWEADVEPILPGTDAWRAVVPVLAAARLNAPDAAGLASRWEKGSLVLRLVERRA